MKVSAVNMLTYTVLSVPRKNQLSSSILLSTYAKRQRYRADVEKRQLRVTVNMTVFWILGLSMTVCRYGFVYYILILFLHIVLDLKSPIKSMNC